MKLGEFKKKSGGIFGIICLILLIGLGFGYYKYRQLSQNFVVNRQTLSETQKALADAKDTNDYILKKFTEEQDRNDKLAAQVGEITNAVGALDKLSKTDKELLRKYSKVYFLSENYIPLKLESVPLDAKYEKEKNILVHFQVLPFLTQMLADAKAANVPLEIISAYRSFGEQSSLKNSYKFTYGAGTANQFSADQGYSEHQLGTALDFTTPDLAANFNRFAISEQYKWLLDNAYKYGFVLSYPEGNAYYQFEPWHWRFVGEKLALRLHVEGENFYDLDQRVIDNYLINIFD